MNLLLVNLSRKSSQYNLTFSRFKKLENLFLSTATSTEIFRKYELPTVEEKLFKKYEDHILYSDYIERKHLRVGYRANKIAVEKLKKEAEKQENEPLPVTLKFLGYTPLQPKIEEEANLQKTENNDLIQFPYRENTANIENTRGNVEENLSVMNPADETNMEIRTRLELLNKSKDHLKWMNDYENFPLLQTEIDEEQESQQPINYGTPAPRIPTSKVPCGGCGALLHCRDSAIPGYIPSEIFLQHDAHGGVKLEGIHCQRCHFLEHYNMALQVRVSPDDYPKVLRNIADKKRALVILLVDLLDFPCSIWPGITDLIGERRPIFVVGNKVDLLPDDGKGYLNRVTKNLANSVREAGFAMTNIQHVALISAKTGFGVEDLITRLHSFWQYRGDVYIVGCTNVGKSTLFNILLQTDYCKGNAVDLVQRATTSLWPGTTLNLLKFPILRPSGWLLYNRHKRLQSTRHLDSLENQLRQQSFKSTGKAKFASLVGKIERSFDIQEPLDDEQDIYAIKGNANSMGQKSVGIHEKDKRFALNKWCYDTPGVVQPEQILHHFTTDELVKVFPNRIITPRTFSIQPGSSLFIAGIARVDYVGGNASCRFTVFASNQLPVTICKSKEVDEIYKELLLSEALQVPICNSERLKSWPGLEGSKYFTVTGIDRHTSCADLVLSSAGWVAVTPNSGATCTIQGWTPERRGIYLRDSLLPNIVRNRGKKIRGSCAYR